mmetsp:Transcript_38432/g.96689  ORF Transcript_38432/g.96689 Transcript_38432/m.96689 type:complete len:331 (-) Transcript_38432:69-1061(-)|eukprot:CAMPEP_0177648096 /NCGR_PEP_ID=MMETSP0447-20121125/10649_1 /TAXON_ID=0 /ORGANISM="Stygamoeba regulata, Strain BSH-02190019" /LENGTH=330 /DNA_ID=CAMNT_0019150721 /DNA_START=50 /DNA_END=1042 /DNA_ORIENTATION=-
MTDWDEVTYYVLGSIELLLAAVATFQLVRIFLCSQEIAKSLHAKKLFHIVIIATMLVRATMFLTEPWLGPILSSNHSDIVYDIWNMVGGFLFLSAYGLLLVYWADFYYFVSQRQQISRFYRYAILITVAVVLCLLVVLFTTLLVVFSTRAMQGPLLVMERVSTGTLALLFVFCGCGFFIYGFALWKTVGIGCSSSTSFIKVIVVCNLCTCLFLLRACFSLWSTVTYSTDKEGIVAWIVFLYYFFLECVPIGLMLFLLWRLPSRRPPYLSMPDTDDVARLTDFRLAAGHSFEHYGAHPYLYDHQQDDLYSWESQHNSDPLLPNASTIFYSD